MQHEWHKPQHGTLAGVEGRGFGRCSTASSAQEGLLFLQLFMIC